MSAAPKVSPTQNPLTDKDFVTTFVQAAVKTHQITANTELQPDKPVIYPEFIQHGEVIGFVGVTSNGFKWILSISYPRSSALSLFNNMFGEMKSDLDNEVQDLIGEITNQVYGTAKQVLNQKGFKFEMALPTVISGDFKAHLHGGGTTLCVPFAFSNTEKAYLNITMGK